MDPHVALLTVQLYLPPSSWKMKNASSTFAPPRYRFTQAAANCVSVESSSAADIACACNQVTIQYMTIQYSPKFALCLAAVNGQP